MGKWWIRVTTDKGYRDYTWDEKHGTIAEHDWLGCDHSTGSTARDLSTAEGIARRHAERQTGSSAREIEVWDPAGNHHHKERLR